MKTFLSPKLDIVFKKLFITNPMLLIDLLNQIFIRYSAPTIDQINILNNEILPETEEDKKIVLDILGLNIEMQAKKTDNYPERSLYYLSRLYSQQMESGQSYTTLKPTIGIHFLDFKCFQNNTWHYCFELRDRDNPNLRYTDHMQLFLFELPKIKTEQSNLEQWLYFFNHANNEVEATMREHYTHPPIQKAFETLEKISQDKVFALQALARERALIDEITRIENAEEKGFQQGKEEGIKEGIKEGKTQEKLVIAKSLLEKNIPIETIIEATGLSIEAIEKLKTNS